MIALLDMFALPAMCLAIPGKIEEFIDAERHFARAAISGVKRQINVDLIKEQGLEVGDWVLIHVGFAMGKISEEHAMEQLAMLAILGEAEQSRKEAEGYSFEFSGSASSSAADAGRKPDIQPQNKPGA